MVLEYSCVHFLFFFVVAVCLFGFGFLPSFCYRLLQKWFKEDKRSKDLGSSFMVCVLARGQKENRKLAGSVRQMS